MNRNRMECSRDYIRLYETLDVLDYPYLTRMLHFRTLSDITVQDFICIVAFLGNQACHQFCNRNPFPHIYSKLKFLITKEEQQMCCELISEFAGHLKFQPKLTKSVIMCSGITRYAQQKNDFLMLICDYIDQVFCTTPTSPEKILVPADSVPFNT